jgi:hypothetical protein
MKTEALMHQKNVERDLRRLYWAMRIGIAFIWIWTAITSWFLYPHNASLAWLHSVGVINQSMWVFTGACLCDLVLGIAAAFFACRRLWQIQCAIVIFYSLVIAICLPEFLFHPFGAIVKNIAVLMCLAYLMLMEKR